MSTAEPVPDAQRVMALLAAGVPLTLLLDLVCGPHSEDLLLAERPRGAPAERT